MSFFPTTDVSPAQGRALARALHTVAAADGAHPREVALIDALFAELGEAASTIAPADLAAELPTADLRLMFMKLAYLVAHNEGGVTEAERASIEGFASALGVSGADRLALEGQVIEQMMAAIRS